MIKYLLKIYHNEKNAAHSVLENTNYFHLQLKARSVYMPMLLEFLKDTEIELDINAQQYNLSLVQR